MRFERSLLVGAGKVLLAGAVYFVGSILGGLAATALGLEMPDLLATVDPEVQLALLFLGGLAMSLGLAPLAVGLAGRWWQRWGVLSIFVLLVSSLGTVLETSIFTTLGGEGALFLPGAAAGVLCALLLSLAFGPSAGPGMGRQLSAFFDRWKTPGILWRLGVAVLAFPFFYFLFGMIVAPHVIPYYERLDFLVIPAMPTLLGVLLARSVMFLVASLLVIAAWSGSRRGLVVALGLGHFVAVGLVGLIQTPMFPAFLRWVHGVEILADSMFYAWALVWLFWPRSLAGEKSRTAVATSSAAGGSGVRAA